MTEIMQRQLANKPVCVHASMRSFGKNRRSADSLLDQLLGMGCTIVVPTFTYELNQPPPRDDRPSSNGLDYDSDQTPEHDRHYDPAGNDLTLAEMGAFPAAVLARRERVRGNHPLNSFSAIGPEAGAIISRQTPDRVYGPLEQLCTMGGAVLLMGVTYTSMTLLHLAEADAGRPLFRRWAKQSDGLLVSCITGGCSAGFDKFDASLKAVRERVEGSHWRYLDASETRTSAATVIRDQPDITNCGRQHCLRCRDAIGSAGIDRHGA